MAFLAACANHRNVIHTGNYDRIDQHEVFGVGCVVALHAIGSRGRRLGVNGGQARRRCREVGMAVTADRGSCDWNMPARQGQRTKTGKAGVAVRAIQTGTGVGRVVDCKRTARTRTRLESSVVGMRHIRGRRQAWVQTHANPLHSVAMAACAAAVYAGVRLLRIGCPHLEARSGTR